MAKKGRIDDICQWMSAPSRLDRDKRIPYTRPISRISTYEKTFTKEDYLLEVSEEEVDNLVIPPTIGSTLARIAAIPTDLREFEKSVKEQFDRIGKYEIDWDGEGAEIPQKNLLLVAEVFLLRYAEAVWAMGGERAELLVPHIGYSANHSVHIFWEVGELKLLIKVIEQEGYYRAPLFGITTDDVPIETKLFVHHEPKSFFVRWLKDNLSARPLRMVK